MTSSMKPLIGRFAASVTLTSTLAVCGLITLANAAPVIIGPTYSEDRGANCFTTASCNVAFTPIARSKTLLISRVGCQFFLPFERGIHHVILHRLEGSSVKGLEFLGAPISTGNSATSHNLRFNEAVHFQIGPKQHAQVSFAMITSNPPVPKSVSISCSIHGVISDAPQ